MVGGGSEDGNDIRKMSRAPMRPTLGRAGQGKDSGAKKDSEGSGASGNRSDGLHSISKAAAGAEEGGALPPDGQVGVGVLGDREAVGTEYSLRCVNRQPGGAAGEGEARGADSARGGGVHGNRGGGAVDIAGMQDLFKSRLNEQVEGMELQGPYPSTQATTAGTGHEVGHDGQKSGQIGTTDTGGDQGVVNEVPRDGVGDGEPSRVAGKTGIHGEAVEAAKEARGGTLLRIRSCIQQTDPHMDEYIRVEASGTDRYREVRVQVQCREGRAEGEVATQVHDSWRQCDGGTGQREGSYQEHGAAAAAAGDLGELDGMNDESLRKESGTDEILFREGGFKPD